MTPKTWDEFVYKKFSGPSESDANVRTYKHEGDPLIDKVSFEVGYIDIEFDLDARDELAQRVQRYRVEEFERLMAKVFEYGVDEGKRQIRTMVREVAGIQ